MPSRLDASIPGESFTGTPGNAPYEHPPQFADVDEALEHVWERLNTKKSQEQLLAALKQGVPVEALAKTTLFTGFSHGKWTVDAAAIMAKPVVAMMASIAKVAGVDNAKLQSVDRSTNANIGNMVNPSQEEEEVQPQQNSLFPRPENIRDLTPSESSDTRDLINSDPEIKALFEKDWMNNVQGGM